MLGTPGWEYHRMLGNVISYTLQTISDSTTLPSSGLWMKCDRSLKLPRAFNKRTLVWPSMLGTLVKDHLWCLLQFLSSEAQKTFFLSHEKTTMPFFSILLKNKKLFKFKVWKLHYKIFTYYRGKKDTLICLCMISNRGRLTQHKTC